MATCSFSRLVTLFLLLCSTVLGAFGVPSTLVERSAAPLGKRYSPSSAPYFVEYFDKGISGGTGMPAVSDLSGYNVFIISFLLTEGAWDNAEVWASLTEDERNSTKADYNAAGIALMVSIFGSSDVPTSSGDDPTDTANTMAAWVKQYGLDGVDVDYEDFDAFDAGTAEAWLITFTTQLRSQLPASDYIITHAPVAPWFSSTLWTNGGYLKVDSEVGDLIDWYNVQFYNQGSTEYTTCDGLLVNSSSTWPDSALFQIIDNGVDQDKLVIGKPANTGDANSGYMSTSTLASCIQQANAEGWDAGVMVWQYPDAGTTWITAVRADTWPVS